MSDEMTMLAVILAVIVLAVMRMNRGYGAC